MAYDHEPHAEGLKLPLGKRRAATASSRDLETIVTMIDLAALSLTTSDGASFSEEQLLAEIQEICGPDLVLEPRDVRNVLERVTSLKKRGGLYTLR